MAEKEKHVETAPDPDEDDLDDLDGIDTFNGRQQHTKANALSQTSWTNSKRNQKSPNRSPRLLLQQHPGPADHPIPQSKMHPQKRSWRNSFKMG